MLVEPTTPSVVGSSGSPNALYCGGDSHKLFTAVFQLEYTVPIVMPKAFIVASATTPTSADSSAYSIKS
jgi:hypothetical protein